MNKEIKLARGTHTRDFCSYYNGLHCIRVCSRALHKHVSLSSKCNTIIIVATKTSSPDAFKIGRPQELYVWSDEESTIDVPEDLYYLTGVMLAKLYREGYRYVRVEY